MQTLKPLHEITVVFTKRTDLFHQGGTGLGQHLLTGDRFALRSLLRSFISLPACPLCTAFVINVEQLKSLTWVPARPVFLRVHITFLGWSWTGWWKSEVRGSCPSRQPAHKVCLPSSSYWCWWIRILLSILVIFFFSYPTTFISSFSCRFACSRVRQTDGDLLFVFLHCCFIVENLQLTKYLLKAGEISP